MQFIVKNDNPSICIKQLKNSKRLKNIRL